MALKKAHLRQVHGISFAAHGDSHHWVMMDGSPDFDGANAASTPKELLLIALAGCTASDVVPILKKKKARLDHLEINVSANDREEHPRIFTDLHVEYVLYGDKLKVSDVERAIELSTKKYCSVTAILSASVPITHSYRIEPFSKLRATE